MREIQKISVTDAVVERLKSSIEAGEFKEGQKLPTESQLCDMLKVSRTCIREALRYLQAMKLVTIKPGKGSFVASFDDERPDEASEENIIDESSFHEYIDVRKALEILSVKLAVEKASPQQIEELQSIHTSFVQATKDHNLAKMIMLDELFHTKIASFSQNKFIIRINKELVEFFRRYRGNSFADSDVYFNAVNPHSNILECFLLRDSERAVEEMKAHIEITANDIALISKPDNKPKKYEVHDEHL
ncbi:MAG: FadR/GntR family transcriptional regulator [Clostridia bacterium]|nr:FadR/GntR family transcriptional regulator [Clostridia bacterium]